MKNQRLFDTATIVTIGLVADRIRSLFVPILAMVVSDLALGVVLGEGYALHSAQPWVYGCVVAIALFGHAARTWKPISLVLGGGSIAAIVFFLVTNFAVWMSGSMYPISLEGLIACYAAGLAFYRDGGNFLLNGILSTWLFAAVIAVAPRLFTSMTFAKASK